MGEKLQSSIFALNKNYHAIIPESMKLKTAKVSPAPNFYNAPANQFQALVYIYDYVMYMIM